MEELKADKVFISYAWSSPDHEEWVVNLAKRLTHNNVEVVLDKWDAAEGQDLNAFMLRCVNDSDITKVLVISDEIYSKKANGYEGGVGTETVIISNEVFRDVEQTKFIPIVAERDENGDVYLPTYFQGKKYIDMSSDQNYEDGYEKLLRNLFGKPEFIRPERGDTPSFLLHDEKKSTFQSQIALYRFKRDSERKPQNIDVYFNEFADDFRNDFKSYAIKVDEREQLTEKVFGQFHDMIDLRDIYLEFLESYIKESNNVDSDLIIDLFESLYPIIETKFSDTFFSTQFDHMKLFVTELVIYTVAILYKYKKYEALKTIIVNGYIVEDSYGREYKENISIFRSYPQLIEEGPLPSTGQQYISNSGHLIVERANYEGISANDVIQADFLILFLNYANDKMNDYYNWFPTTSPYITRENLTFMRKIKGKRFFENVKELFEVSNREEMIELTEGFRDHLKEMARTGGRSMRLHHIIPPPEEIASF